jgi:putative endonuclease
MKQKRETGNQGEMLAAQYLEAKGYQIVERNWSCRLGELDIVAKTGETFLFCEVKTVHGLSTEGALANFTASKLQKLLRAIHIYLDSKGFEESLWRLDVIAIAIPAKGAPVIEHLEDALDW